MNEEIIMRVNGMSCLNCERKIEAAVSALTGVKYCKANANNAQVTINCPREDDIIQAVKATIVKAGFEVLD